MYDFQAGKWTDPFLTGIGQLGATGKAIGTNSAVVEFDITAKTPARFVDSADSKTVVIRLTVFNPKMQRSLSDPQPPPLKARLSNFNVTF